MFFALGESEASYEQLANMDASSKTEKKSLEKDIYNANLNGKSLDETIAFFSDPDSEEAQKIENRNTFFDYRRALVNIKNELDSQRFFTKTIIEEIQNFPSDTELKFIIQDIVALEIFKSLDFREYPSDLNSIVTVLKNLKTYLPPSEYLQDEQGNQLPLDEYFRHIANLENAKRQKLAVEERIINKFTTNYNLQRAVRNCFDEKDIIKE